MKQTLNGTVEVWKQAARGKLCSLLRSDLIARETRAENGTQLGEELKNQRDEARVKLRGDGKNDVWRSWRMKVIEDLAYSGWKVNGGFGELEGEDFYFKKPMAVQVLEEFMRHRVE